MTLNVNLYDRNWITLKAGAGKKLINRVDFNFPQLGMVSLKANL